MKDKKFLYKPNTKYNTDSNKKTVHGGRVFACNKEFVSKSFKYVKISENFNGEDLKVSVLFDKCFQHINTIQNYYKEVYEARFTD